MPDESNVRKVVAPDMAFDRWRSERMVIYQPFCDCGLPHHTEDHDRVVFRAGYEACLRGLAEARQ